jgi:predicted nucleic acid-binding Zn ribbon protein
LGKCLKCKKSKKLVKLVSAPGFRLKGSGWYETDFKVGAKKNIHGEEKKAKSKKDEN